MKNKLIFPFLFVIICIISSCGVTKDYKYAVVQNSIESYESYQELYPKSKYKSDVKQRLAKLYDEREWKMASDNHNIEAYSSYLNRFPNGMHRTEAENQIDKIRQQKEIDDAWKNAKQSNTIEVFQAFIDRYDYPPYEAEAKSKIRTLIDENAWGSATRLHSIEAYNDYLKSNPEGKHRSQAIENIAKINEEKTVLPIWNKTLQIGTYQAFAEFLRNYPKSSYAKQAQDNLDKIESAEWEKATRTNTIRGYQTFKSKFPNSDYVEVAEKRIIDLEVDKIFDGDYGMLPPLNKDSYGGYKSTNSVEIYNNTGYNLTIRYSGSESKKIVLYPKQRLTTTLPNGIYRITASVNAANVRNYAGNETLSGGNYSSEYYIITTRF